MWPFIKQALRSENLPIDGPWSVSDGQNDGMVMIVRANTGYLEFGSLQGYEHQVGIAVPLHAPEPTGLPSVEENAQLDEIEDAISLSLQREAESLLVAVITTDGMREFVLYTRAPHDLERRFEQLREQITSHEMQMIMQPDKRWEIYAQLTDCD